MFKLTQYSVKEIELARVFISHRSADTAKANRLANLLTKAGHQVTFDVWELEVGDSIPSWMNHALGGVDYVVVCLSSLGLASWMSSEVWSAYSRQLNGQSIKLLPVRFRDGQIPPLLADIKYADLAKDWKFGVTELLRAIR